MYRINFRNALGDTEMEDSGRFYSKLDGRGMLPSNEPLDLSPTQQNSQLDHIKISEELKNAFVDAPTVSSYNPTRPGQRKNFSPVQQHERDSRRFQKELQKAHHELSQRGEQSPKEDNCSNGLAEETRAIVKSAVPSSSDTEKPSSDHRHESKHESGKSNRQLRKELHRTTRILECERSQKNALQERLEEVEHRLEHRTQSTSDKLVERYGQKIRTLQDEVEGYQIAVETERTKSQRLQQELESARKETRKCMEKMRLLMFQHIPNSSTKFMDVGSVDIKIEESPASVGDYQLGKKLGEGHYGTVQVGTHITTNASYAVKVLNKERINRFKDLQQIAMEVHVLKHYQHPNIIHLQDVIHASENIYLATELCLMDLHKYHNDIGLTEESAKEVIFGVLRPLHHLHSHGVCHLDLKPENILIARSANLKSLTFEDIRLCDFGLVNMAKKSDGSKEIFRKGYACGTPGFFAPEMILKNEFEGRLADMWSLGCIILEITLGFTQEWIDSYEKVDSDAAAFQAGLEDCLKEIAPARYPHHPNLLNIIHRCLTIDPSTRISSADASIHPWLQDMVVHDENREDSGHSRQDTVDTALIDAERGAFAASAFLC